MQEQHNIILPSFKDRVKWLNIEQLDNRKNPRFSCLQKIPENTKFEKIPLKEML